LQHIVAETSSGFCNKFAINNHDILLQDKIMVTNYIAQIRKERGLSQEVLAERLGVSHQQISFLENGKRSLKWEVVQRLANILECHPMDITQGPAEMTMPVERELMQKFRGMSEPDRVKYISMADIFLSTPKVN
jgi:transcriptional regulator with XRE-family HTH domain